jgi:ankyrin repeat protein
MDGQAPPGKELIVTRQSLPTRTLRQHPDLEQIKRQAKELLESFRNGDSAAVDEVNAQYHGADPQTFALHDAQLVIARAYGFESWPKLKAFVDGATVRRLVDAVRTRNMDAVRAMLQVRPELARMSIDNLQVVHHAVLARAPEMVRVLMVHGANARDGVYPHRDATTAHAIALQRGYDDIVRSIEEEEQNQRNAKSGLPNAPAADDLFGAIASGNNDRAIALLNQNPLRIHTRHTPSEASPLHAAAQALDATLVAWLLDHGADPRTRMHHDLTPIDLAAHRWYRTETRRFEAVARLLLDRGAPMTPAAAAALGDADWLRARHVGSTLTDQNDGSGGLLRIAVTHNRSEILDLLLDFGFDPDERVRLHDGDDAPFTWGMALQHAVQLKRYDMAETLLESGADPNASIYASGDPVFSAYSEGDQKMVALLERYGGIPAATTAGLFRQTELAEKMLAGEAPYRIDGAAGESLGEQLLWGGACGGDPEIVRRALEHVDWPRDDPRWFTILEQPLRTWTHGSVSETWDKSTYLACFRLLLERCDPNLRGRPTDGGQFGLTTLHNIVARGDMTPEERVAFATAILDRGARLDIRDYLLKSTPLGWACRWGHLSLVKLFLDRGADPIEVDAEPWAMPRAWAEKMNRTDVLAELRKHQPIGSG